MKMYKIILINKIKIIKLYKKIIYIYNIIENGN